MGVTDISSLDRPGSPLVTEASAGSTATPATVDRRLAFRRLAEEQLDRSYRLAAVVLGDPADAEDAVHDAFVTAWQRWDSLRDTSRFEAWFCRIVVNTCRNRAKRARRWRISDIADERDLATADPTVPLADEIVVQRAFARLKADDRIVLALRYYRDLKVDDIAAVLGIGPRAVSSRLHRALERLRRVLHEYDVKEVRR